MNFNNGYRNQGGFRGGGRNFNRRGTRGNRSFRGGRRQSNALVLSTFEGTCNVGNDPRDGIIEVIRRTNPSSSPPSVPADSPWPNPSPSITAASTALLGLRNTQPTPSVSEDTPSGVDAGMREDDIIMPPRLGPVRSSVRTLDPPMTELLRDTNVATPPAAELPPELPTDPRTITNALPDTLLYTGEPEQAYLCHVSSTTKDTSPIINVNDTLRAHNIEPDLDLEDLHEPDAKEHCARLCTKLQVFTNVVTELAKGPKIEPLLSKSALIFRTIMKEPRHSLTTSRMPKYLLNDNVVLWKSLNRSLMKLKR